MSSYKHTQIGHVILVATGIPLVFSVAMVLVNPAEAVYWVILVVFALSVVLFASLTVEIADGLLKWSFGPGLIHKSVRLADIESVEALRPHWICGWGIHLTRKGWLYNVSGREAVHIRLKTGKQFLLGTDEPNELFAAIRANLI